MANRDVTFELFTEAGASDTKSYGDNVTITELGPLSPEPSIYQARLLWDQRLVREAMTSSEIDVFLGPVVMCPIERSCPAVVIVHDIIFETHPQFYSLDALGYYGTYGRRAVHSAEGIVTVSNDTKTQLIERWGVDEAKITVGYAGVDEDFKLNISERRATHKHVVFPFSQKYILYVGRVDGRKNIETLFLAYAALPSSVRNQFKLVFVVGTESKSRSDRIRAFLTDSRIRHAAENVELYDYVELPQLVELYRNASAFVYPSLYEGFGLPPLEAMTSGVPVIATTTPAVSEVCKDAAILVDPLDVDAMSAAIRHVVTDEALASRMRVAGLKRSKDFSWDLTASTTVAMLREVLARKNAD